MFLIKVLVFGVLVAKAKLEDPALKYSKNFIKPCFDDDEGKQEYCSSPDGDCAVNKVEEKAEKRKVEGKEEETQSDKLKLVRLNGVIKGYEQEVDLGEDRKFKLITKAMKPLMFEIPDFLSDDESAHIIELANEAGMSTSIAGFQQGMYDGDLEKELQAVDSSAEIPDKDKFAANFNVWDKNKNGVLNIEEIKFFVAKYRLLFLAEDEIDTMFDKLQFYGYENGEIKRELFHLLDIPKLLVYLKFLKDKSPRHRPRFSNQAWLPQNKASDPVLRRLLERVTKLTKLPRKLIQGGEALQVVNYQPFGHYHIHYDSTPQSDSDVSKPCCHLNIAKPYGCRLCRFITILYYLNDVEEGGETAFVVADNTTYNPSVLSKPTSKDPVDDFNLSVNCHRSNLVVKPKKNSAIMWYNHFVDEETGLLGEVDTYSLHGGCDVIKGEKWIANNWLTAPVPGMEHLQSVYDVGYD